MAINEKLIVQEAAAGVDADPNIMLDLNAGDVDSYDGDGDVWYDIHDFEFKPTTNVSEHFNTVLYTGDGTNDSTKSITGVGFTPDFVWIKNRDTGSNHYVTDSVRGDNKHIYTESTSIENGNSVSSYGGVLLNSDGFTVNKGTNSSSVGTNATGDDYVSWCFNAGGVEETNTDGDHDSTVRANNDLGFSVVKGSGSGTGVQTVGHGLDSAPEMVIIKNIAVSDNWWVYHKDTGVGKYLQLNTTAATANWADNMVVNSTEIGVRQNSTGSWGNLIAYCFTSKRGVSKVGSYIGDGTTNNKIYTGFEPAFIIIKRTDSTSNWRMYDNVRGTQKELYANSSAQEPSDVSNITFNRDGFTLTSNGGWINNSGGNFIYYAVAKNTNETSLISDTDLELNLEADSYSGSGNWLDSSGNGNNGTITGATWEKELGNFFDLDGSGDYIDAPTSGVFTGDFTVEMWWNFDTLSDGYRMLLGGSGYSSGTGLGHYIENNRLRTWVSVSGSTSNVLNGSGTDLTTNKWQQVVLTRSGGTYTQYIDTNQVGQASGTTASLDGTNSRIGGHYNASGYNINAKVGQVRLYSTALSQEQIRQNFNFTKPKYPNEFHGDLISTPTWNSNGYFDFNGSTQKVVLAAKVFPINPIMTTSTWVKGASFSNSGGPDIIYQSAGGGSYTALLTTGGNLQVYVRDSSGTTYTPISYSLSNFNTSSWYHLLVTYEGLGGSIKLYVNGSNVASGTSQTTTKIYTVGSSIAGETGSNVLGWSGSISKFKLYNKVLTQAEITALSNEGE